jgi:signal transduction histidine kinase
VSSLYAQLQALDIDQEVNVVLSNGLPSLRTLGDARTAMRHLEVASDAYAEGAEGEREEHREALESARTALGDALVTYLALPEYEGELALYSDVPTQLEAIDSALTVLRSSVRTGDTARAREAVDKDLRGAIERLDREVLRIVSFNGEHLQLNAQRVAAIRRHGMTVSFVLDGVCVALLLVAAALSLRALRRYMQLSRAHGDLVARRADELEQFATRVAHDLVSPLAALSFVLAFLKRNVAQDKQVDAALVRADGCVKRSQTMVRAIFEFARSGARPRPGAQADVEKALEDAIDELAVAEIDPPDVKVEPFEPCAVACEPGVLLSMVSNLVHNAAKHTRDCAMRAVCVRVLPSGARVRVEVEDTGPGLPPDMSSSVFEPYVRGARTPTTGLGLGLATVKRFAEAHGGAVGVRSTPGAGCCFWFELPAFARPASVQEERAHEEPASAEVTAK